MTTIERSGRDRSLAAAVPAAEDPVPAPVEPAGISPARRLPRRTWLAAIAGVLVLPLAVAAALTFTAAGSDDRSSNAAAARVVSAADLESEYGIRVNLVAVTADGGLIDLRFTVLDKEKAGHILHESSTLPELLVETTGAVLSTRNPMAHKLTLLDGASYFLLYPNSGGAIQGGTPVSVVIDDIRLPAIDAQS